jgi:hypothetical protein
VSLDVELAAVSGTWLRHTPADSSPAARPDPTPDNRWQRGEIVDALYLCDHEDGVWAEWYRHLAELGVPPRFALPRELWSYAVDGLEVVDLSTEQRLVRVGLSLPLPGRGGWPAFQAVGERLFADGAAGLLAPSAARPASRVLCVFLPATTIPGALHPQLPPTRIDHAPAPPTGMRT